MANYALQLDDAVMNQIKEQVEFGRYKSIRQFIESAVVKQLDSDSVSNIAALIRTEDGGLIERLRHT